MTISNSTLHVQVPEMPEAAPKLYRVCSRDYLQRRSLFQRTLLSAAQLLLFAINYVEKFKHLEAFER